MEKHANSEAGVDSGLYSLVTLARFFRVPLEPDQLYHQFGNPGSPFSEQEILRASKTLGFKVRSVRSSFNKIQERILPCISTSKDGEFFILARIEKLEDENESKVYIQNAGKSSLEVLKKEDFEEIWSEKLILLSPRSEGIFGRNSVFDISWFVPSIIKYKKILGEVVITSFFLQVFALVTPLFFQVVMDKVLVHKGLTTLDVLTIGFVCIAFFDALLGGFRNYIFSHTANRIDVELGSKLFNHLLRLPLSYFESRQVGQNVARVKELDTIRNFITSSALTLIIDLFFTFVFFAVMWFYSRSLTLIVLATLPFYICLSIVITPILRNRLEQKFKHGALNQAFLVESITGIETLKASAVEPQMQRKWEDQLADYVSSSFKATNLGNIANQIAGFINKITTVLIIWWGAQLVIEGKLTVGQLIAFNMIAGRVSAPILKLVNLWQDFQQAKISINKLGDILNTPREPGFNPGRSSLPKLRGEIKFENIDFRYRPGGPLIINNLSLDIRKGEVIGIVGKSGSGKSTLTKLIQRLYVPENGSILVDGVDTAMIDTNWLRRNIGVVLQENFLFDRSVRENIALSNPGVSIDRVVWASKLACAHEFILQLPNGYDNSVGERGCNLSGGQRQRIAIARALITDPMILIFDEATSALDYESEEIIQSNMESICVGRTVFIIAHRLSTVRNCNKIIVVDKGKIVENGNHDELIEKDGYYAKLYSYQNYKPKKILGNKVLKENITSTF